MFAHKPPLHLKQIAIGYLLLSTPLGGVASLTAW